ncbi:MAG: hypothetical protein PWQ60_2394 [Thermoanaerobacteraceae bacterium]|nr:hypothetical protein [Thermoanaerobacteraceae bacterium]
MSKTYGFRLGENDADIEKVLESLAGKDRSLYIRAALKHYIEYGDKIDNIANETKEILTILKSGVLNIEK